jgi:hypothetical protein
VFVACRISCFLTKFQHCLLKSHLGIERRALQRISPKAGMCVCSLHSNIHAVQVTKAIPDYTFLPPCPISPWCPCLLQGGRRGETIHSIFCHSISTTGANKKKAGILPIQTISLSRRRCQTMAQHHRYLCTNLVGDIRPLRPFPEGKRLSSFGLEWRGKETHRFNMGVKHDL